MTNRRLEELAKSETDAVRNSLMAHQGTVGYHSLSLALGFADKGDERKVAEHLDQAREYCNTNRMIFPDKVAVEIMTTATIQDWRLKEKIRSRRLRAESVSYS